MVNVLTLSRRDSLRHALLRAGAPVGWIDVGTIGFGGFSDRAQARQAGEVVAGVVDEWHRRRLQSRPAAWPTPVAADDRIEAAGATIGRLVAPLAVGDRGDGFGIEIGVPPDTWLALRMQLAQQLYAALTDAGLTRDAVPAEASA